MDYTKQNRAWLLKHEAVETGYGTWDVSYKGIRMLLRLTNEGSIPKWTSEVLCSPKVAYGHSVKEAADKMLTILKTL